MRREQIRRDFDMIRVEERGILLIGHTGWHEMPSTLHLRKHVHKLPYL